MQRSAFLGKLQKGRERNGITVRVVRKWTLKENSGHGVPLYVAMVVADAKGDAMYAEIAQEAIQAKEYLLDIGKIYDIKKFKVNNAKPTYKPFDGALMIEITEFTTIELTKNPPATIPEYIYSLTPFSAIVPASGPVSKYTDVIGYITKYTALSTFVPKNKEKVTILRELYLKDLRDNEMKITLWGDHATNFNIDHVYNEEAGNLIVCLLLGCIPRRMYTDYTKTYLSGSAACSYCFNPQIREAGPYHSKFKDIPVYIDRPAPSEQDPPVQVQDTPLQQKTIAELNSIDPFDFEDGTYKCAVTITSIPNNNSWWYISCVPCKKRAEQQPDHTYKCPKCQGYSVIPRYLLSFTGTDDTAEARFFAYDEEAKLIVQKDCDAVISPLALAAGLPPALQRIIDKRYVFSVDLTDDSYTSQLRRQYLVKSVLERPARHASTPNVAPPAAPSTSTTPSTSAQPGTSAAGLPSPQLPDDALRVQSPKELTQQVQSEILQLEFSTQTTPTPTADPEQSPPKDDNSRLPPKVRRNLFEATKTTDKAVHGDDLGVANPLLNDHTRKSASLPEPNPKRVKTNAGQHSSKDSSHESASPTAAN